MTKPVYGPDDAPAVRPPPGEFPYTRGVRPEGYRGRPWTMRQYAGFSSAEDTNQPVPAPARPGPDGPLRRVRPADAARARLRRRAGARRGRANAASRSTRSTTCALLLDGIPLGDVSTSMTINAPASLLLLLYELVAEEQGVGPEALSGNGPERHPEGVHRPRELHLPGPAEHAPDRGHVPLLHRAAAALEHDLDLGLPHPRGRVDGRAGAGLHPRQRHRLRPGGGRRGARGRRVRAQALVLLQRPQRLLRRGGEVPGGADALGRDHARPLRRPRPALADAAVPRPDRRLDAHRPAGREQHRSRRRAGAVGRLRRRPEPAHERLRRGARAPHGALGDDRASHPADPGDRGRSDGERRPAGRELLHRVADRPARRRGP